MSSPLNPTSWQLGLLQERVKVLEEKSEKGKRTITRAQQMLLLKHTGLIKIILDLKTTKKGKAILLGIIVKAGPDNIEDDLTYINDDLSPITTQENYDFIIETFEKAGLENLASDADKILNKII